MTNKKFICIRSQCNVETTLRKIALSTLCLYSKAGVNQCLSDPFEILGLLNGHWTQHRNLATEFLPALLTCKL